jgi:hypothetical protein
MRLLKKRDTGRVEFGLIYGGIALLALCAARVLPILTFLPSCTFRELTGLPCPTCGASRALVYLSQGDILSSVAMNPLISLCLIASLLYFAYSLFTLKGARISLVLTKTDKNIVRASVLFMVLVNWCFLALTL